MDLLLPSELTMNLFSVCFLSVTFVSNYLALYGGTVVLYLDKMNVQQIFADNH